MSIPWRSTDKVASGGSCCAWKLCSVLHALTASSRDDWSDSFTSRTAAAFTSSMVYSKPPPKYNTWKNTPCPNHEITENAYVDFQQLNRYMRAITKTFMVISSTFQMTQKSQ